MATWSGISPSARPSTRSALQLGGSEPDELARCARLGERYGYDEINLNIGCPSERVQKGAFGACLMAEPRLVADCVAAIRRAVRIPVTVKHRIGIDRIEAYDFVRDFVGTVSDGRLPHLHRARAQRRAEGPQPEGEPRDPAAQVRVRLPAQGGLSGARDRHQRRPHHLDRHHHAARLCRRRDARPRRVPQPLAACRPGKTPRRRRPSDVRIRRRARNRCATSRATCLGCTTATARRGCGAACFPMPRA